MVIHVGGIPANDIESGLSLLFLDLALDVLVFQRHDEVMKIHPSQLLFRRRTMRRQPASEQRHALFLARPFGGPGALGIVGLVEGGPVAGILRHQAMILMKNDGGIEITEAREATLPGSGPGIVQQAGGITGGGSQHHPVKMMRTFILILSLSSGCSSAHRSGRTCCMERTARKCFHQRRDVLRNPALKLKNPVGSGRTQQD